MIKVNRATLSNGLRIIHNYDSATAMVALIYCTMSALEMKIPR